MKINNNSNTNNFVKKINSFLTNLSLFILSLLLLASCSKGDVQKPDDITNTIKNDNNTAAQNIQSDKNISDNNGDIKAPDNNTPQEENKPKDNNTPQEENKSKDNNTPQEENKPKDNNTPQEENKSKGITLENGDEIIEITTDKGILSLKLFQDISSEGKELFYKLVKEGFYNGFEFDKYTKDSIYEGGIIDTTGKDTKVPLETIKDLKVEKGFIAFGKGIKVSGGKFTPVSDLSKMFIVLKDDNEGKIKDNYMILGGIYKGIELLDKIKEGEKLKIQKLEIKKFTN